MSKKLMLIVNPAAGRGSYKNNFAEALRELDRGGYTVTVFFTSGRGDAIELAAANASEYDTVACIGGDGTLSEVITGLMRCQVRPPLGYFPMGTANDVATTLGLPKNDCLAAAKRLVSGEAHPFDVGGFGDDAYFAYIAAFGAFTEVSYATPQEAKKQLGEAAYLLGAVKSLSTLKSRHVTVEYDDGVLDGEFLYGSMSNSYSVAGFIDLPREEIGLGDGLHELVLVKKLPNAAAFATLATKVLSHDLSSEYIIIKHTRRARFVFDEPETWTFDGENGGAHSEISFENCPQAIKLVY